MAEETVLSQIHGVDGEGVLDDSDIVVMDRRCHMTEEIGGWRMPLDT